MEWKSNFWDLTIWLFFFSSGNNLSFSPLREFNFPQTLPKLLVLKSLLFCQIWFKLANQYKKRRWVNTESVDWQMRIKPENTLPVWAESNEILRNPKKPMAVLGKFVTWNYLKSFFLGRIWVVLFLAHKTSILHH